MRSPETIVGLIFAAGLAAAPARAASLEYTISGPEPARAIVKGADTPVSGYRLEPGGQLSFKLTGPGVVRALFVADCREACPAAVKLMVLQDGQGAMKELAPRPLAGGSYVPAAKDRALPSLPLPVVLKVEAGEHAVVFKLPGNAPGGGVVAFANATAKGAGDDLDFDLPPSVAAKPASKPADDDLDLDFGPTPRPAPGKPAAPSKPAVAALDLDLDDGPATPAKPAAPARPTPPQKPVAGDDLDLDLDAAPPKPPAKAPEPVAVAQNTPRPSESRPAAPPPPPPQPPPPPPKPVPPAAKPAPPAKAPPKPPPTSALVAVADGPKAPPPPVKVKKKRPPVVRPPEPPPEPPPVLGKLEVGLRGGWAFARGRLSGQSLTLLEVAYRVAPEVRLVLTTGYTMLTGAWTGIEAGRGLGGFLQDTALVPGELGITWEPSGAGGFSPYLGVALASGYADTSLRRYSLKPEGVRTVVLGGTVSVGLRLQAGRGSFVLELRHSEAVAPMGRLSTATQTTLSTSAVTGGYSFSF